MKTRHRSIRNFAMLEPLECRLLLSAASHAKQHVAYHTFIMAQNKHPSVTSPPADAVTPAQMRGSYGIDKIKWGAITGDGAGQTVAIIDVYHYPTAFFDLQQFDAAYSLPDLQLYNGSNTGPWFRQVAQDGSTTFPPTDPAGAGNANGTWEEEEALDIQWVHALAPAANIMLVEANGATDDDLEGNPVNGQGAVAWARTVPGVSAISMSFSGGEFAGETAYDTFFTTPAGHAGVSFLAATGDNGKPSGYPAFSPNVIAVGGTTLSTNGTNYAGESGWNGSGGSVSTVEPKPSYQSSVTQSSTKRINPDVAMDADPNSGVAVYDSFDNFGGVPWFVVGGTSLATPMWSALIAIANQGRALVGLSSLDGRTQTLPALYALPSSDFHDIIAGSNGRNSNALVGYDLVTGRGSPIANLLVPGLAGIGSLAGTVYQDNNSDLIDDNGEIGRPTATVFLDANNNGTLDSGAITTVNATDIPKSIPDNDLAGVSSTLTIPASVNTPITDVNITLHITHTFDKDLNAYLISPTGTQITLFTHVGNGGNNFNNTTLDDQAATSITSGSAPFSNTYRPNPGTLATFNGLSAAGVWTLKIVDDASTDVGTLDSWSITVTTTNETSTTTDVSGNYHFNGLTFGRTYPVREIIPATYIQTSPASAANVAAMGAITGINFGLFPTVFNSISDTDSYYVAVDSTHTMLQINSGSSLLVTPTYQISLSLMPSLTFNFTGTTNNLVVDFTNWPLLASPNVTMHNAVGSTGQLLIIGQSSAQNFVMTDTQIGPTGGNAVLFDNLYELALRSSRVHYSGSLSTLQSLNIGAGCTFIWG